MRRLSPWSLAFAAHLVLACGGASTAPTASCPCATATAATTVAVAAPAPKEASSVAPGSVSVPPSLSHADAVADARELVALLESSHPDCYTAFGGRIAFQRAAARLYADLPAGDVATNDLARRLQELVSTLGDGHTFIEAGRVILDDRAPKLAIRFEVTTDGLHLSATDIPELAETRGARLVTYGGMSVDDLVTRIARQTAVENRLHAYGKLRRWLTDATACTRFLGRDCAASGVEIVLRTPSGASVKRTVTFSTAAVGDPSAWRLPPLRDQTLSKHSEPFFSVMYDHGKVAYFRVANIMGREGYDFARRYGWGDLPSMLGDYYRRRGLKAPEDLDAALAGIPSFDEAAHALLEDMKKNGTATLVIDLRGNDGGVTPSVVPFLYELFGDAYFARPQKAEWVTRYSQIYLDKRHTNLAALQAEERTPDVPLGGYAFSAADTTSATEQRKKQIAEYVEKGFPFAARLAALDGRPFYRPERILVLADAGTYSAGFHFLAYLDAMGAETVGVPPGQSPNTFMEITPFVLTRSHLRGSISNSAQTFLPETPSAKVFPLDHPLTWDDARKLRFDEDAALQMALALARKPKR